MFEKIDTNNVSKNKTGDLPATTAIITNNQIGKFISKDNATILKNVFSATANGFGKAFYQPNEFTILQDSYAFQFKDDVNIKNIHYFITTALNKVYSKYHWANKSGWNKIKHEFIMLPTKSNEIDFEFMESFVAELEAQRVAELEAYLQVSGLDDYELTLDEINLLNWFDKVEWGKFNLKDLFGKATRGKRLKSADRIAGNLPFVTAGETDEGVSAYIGNKVEVFNENTTTIDMFGSAKYRNYKYGADDHVAVVHTENVPKLASIFITSAIHKAAYTGEFNYGKNFYAKDADALSVMLPIKNGLPDYNYMEMIISYVQKLVIKDVVNYADNKIEKTKQVVNYK